LQIPATKENKPLDESQTSFSLSGNGKSIKVYEEPHTTEQTPPKTTSQAERNWTIETGLGAINCFDGTMSAERIEETGTQHVEDIAAQHIEEVGAQHIEDIGTQHIEDVSVSPHVSTPGSHDGQVESRLAPGEQIDKPRKLKIRHRRSSSICLSDSEADKGRQPLS